MNDTYYPLKAPSTMANPTLTSVYIGATIAPATNAPMFLKAAEADKRYTSPDSIAARVAEIQKKRADAVSAAPASYDKDQPYHRPMVGVLHSVCVLDHEKRTVFGAISRYPGRSGAVAVPFVNFMLQAFPGQFSQHLALGDPVRQTLIFGLDIKELLRIAALEVLAPSATDRSAGRAPLPVRFWYNPLNVYDPMDVLLTAHDRSTIDLAGVMTYFGIPTLRVNASAEDLALAAHALVTSAQMVPAYLPESV